MKKIFLLIFILSTYIGPKVNAQSLSIPGQIPDIEEQVSIDMSPSLPKPNQQIKLKVNAYGTDLSKAQITWKVNGVEQKSGRGEQEFETNSGNIGTKTTINISIKPSNGPVIEKTVYFTPQEVDLIWEARSYTPPFYRGKSLQGPMGNVTVLAMPNFKKENKQSVNTNTIKYTWQRNSKVSGVNSGYQKNYFSFKGEILLKPEEIQVEATDDNGGVAKAFLEISPIEPKIFFYENSPLYGILFNKTTSLFQMNNKEISLASVPLFFETTSRNNSELEYTWDIDGVSDRFFKKSDIIFRSSGQSSGMVNVALKVKNKNSFLQEVKKKTYINVNKTEDTLSPFEF